MHHPAAGKDGHSRGSDPGAFSHPEGRRGYHEPQQNVAGGSESGISRQEGEEAVGVDAELEAYVLARIEDRKAAKKAKDFATADAIREELAAKGIMIKDTREGTIWEKI